MLGPARAPPFGQYPVVGLNSVVREPHELSARADVGSCLGTSFRSVPGHGTYFRGSGTTGVGCLQGQMLGPARAPPFVRCLQGQMLGPTRAPHFGQYPVTRPDSVVREPQELSAMADVWSCSGTSYGWLGFSIGLTYVQLCIVHGEAWFPGKFYPGQQTLLPGKFYPGQQALLPGKFYPGQAWFPGKFYPGQQALFSGKFNPGHGEVQPRSTSIFPGEVPPGSSMSSDAEVTGCSVIRLELGFRGPGYPDCLVRPWLE
ncbi:hypothetical protein TIFTF001_053882 [Ficus carica]|uniref:Uncharacterized protein n=1 Tax=Ficus carica TaxID=3494 RepID=A0AA88EHA4_FICCA|nr:hypothetical protein TIFTF001_053879 [Ficus carica]GMN74618.1 hypothetical protein TIFTF001_053882 [Ficus carica]